SASALPLNACCFLTSIACCFAFRCDPHSTACSVLTNVGMRSVRLGQILIESRGNIARRVMVSPTKESRCCSVVLVPPVLRLQMFENVFRHRSVDYRVRDFRG